MRLQSFNHIAVEIVELSIDGWDLELFHSFNLLFKYRHLFCLEYNVFFDLVCRHWHRYDWLLKLLMFYN